MSTPSSSPDQRLNTERNVWLATVRPNGAPHLIPIWFIWHDELIYICTGEQSVKVRNLRRNANVALALEDGSNPLMVEGTARLLSREETPQTVIAQFKTKYDWDILTDNDYTMVIEVMPTKRRGW